MKLRIENPVEMEKRRKAAGALGTAILLAAALGVSACASSRDRRTTEERAADQGLQERVEDALQDDPDLDFSHVDVRARGGVVWLTGWVWSPREQMAAASISRTVPGVKQVVDQMGIKDWAVNF